MKNARKHAESSAGPSAPADVQGTPFMGSGKRREDNASWLERRDDLYHLDARPIFAVGEHNGKTYTKADLAAIVDAYQPLLGQIRPRIKLGHDDAQSYAKLKFSRMGTDKDEKSLGLPALGFVDSLRLNDAYQDRNGRKVEAGTQILADFVNMPSELKDDIDRLAYLDRSAEIIRNYQDKENPEKTWPLVLKAVALLGDELPAVRTLGPLVEHHSAGENVELEVVTFSQETLNMAMGLPAVAAGDKIDAVLSLLQQLLELQKKDLALEQSKSQADTDEELKQRASMGAEDMKAKGMHGAAMAEEKPAVPAVPAVPVKEEKAAEKCAEDRFAEVQSQLEQANRQAKQALLEVAELKASEAAKLSKIEAERFAESVTKPENFKLPVAMREDVARLFAAMPDVAKFSDGKGGAKNLREQFVDFVNALPVLARPEAFQDRARSHSGAAGSTEAKVEKMAEELATKNPGMTKHAAFMQVHRNLSNADYMALRGADLAFGQ